MEHYREYQCGACDYYFSHPIDRCPICGDQFFWLLMTHDRVAPSERAHFVSQMKTLGGSGVTEEFLTYRDRMWLPYNFWEKDPGGESLQSWSFIKDVKLYQHKRKETPKDEDDTTVREVGFETNPAHPVLKLTDLTSRPREQPQQEVTLTPSRNDQQMGASTPALPSYQAQAPIAPQAPKSSPVETAPASLGPREWLPPILIFVFFLLLSLSFLVLRYHKNDRHTDVSQNFEATYDRSFLS